MNSKFSRRSFLKWITVIFGAGIASACERVLFTPTVEPSPTATLTKSASPTLTSIGTATPEIPSTATSTPTPECSDDDLNALSQPFQIDGVRYEALVPDTLDLQERSELTINALTQCTNPEENYDAYFYGELRRNPPVMYRQMPFPQDFMGKWWEGLGLMRYVTGSSFNNHVDQHWREIFIEWFRRSKPLLDGPGGGRLLCWIANNYRIEGNPCWAAIAEQALETLSNALSHRGDICFFTDENGAMETGWAATFRGWTLQGVSSVFTATGSPLAGRLASGLARYLKDHAKVFNDHGNFIAGQEGGRLHFHHNGNTMVGLSEYALAAGDQEYATFAQKGYEFALASGSPTVGFFPEYIKEGPNPRPYVPDEACCNVDMIMLAINLTKLGQGDYWDDVDRYLRNQFIEMQMRDGRWVLQAAASHGNQPVGEGEDGVQIAERLVGSFSGWASANDYQASINEPFISACCTGNAARALHYIWENMIEYDAYRLQRLKLHLLLNRASPWADIDSYIPYIGQVDIKMKMTTRLEVRIPEWVEPEQVACSVDGTPIELSFQGRYAVIDHVQSGRVVVFTFPISERTVEETIGDVPYTLIIKGNDVVWISPGGVYHPFYQRSHYRGSEVLWVTRHRFVAG